MFSKTQLERRGGVVGRLDGSEAVVVNEYGFAGVYLSDIVRAHMVEGAGFGGDYPAARVAVQLADAQRPDAERVPDSEQAVLGENGQGVSALEPSHEVGHAAFPVLGRGVGEDAGYNLGVVGSDEAKSALLHLAAQG